MGKIVPQFQRHIPQKGVLTMSVVVAIKAADRIYIGSDSQVTKGGTRTTLKNENNYKIWKVLNVDHCLMGHVGYLRDSNVVRLIDDLVTDYDVYNNSINYRFVVKRITPYIMNTLRDYGFVKDDKVFDGMESSFFFAYKDHLYFINSDTSVIEIEDCAAMGSGSEQAIGSLLSTVNEDPEARIIKAIKASAASDIYVDYPIIISNTEDTVFKVINETDIK